MKKQNVEEFLQQIALFPLVEGEVINKNPQGIEVKIVGLDLHAECPLTETTEGLQKGESGLFYVASCDKHGTALVSYKKGVEFEAMYQLAINETAVHAHALPVRELLEQMPFESVIMAFDDEVMLRDAVAILPLWEITSFDDLPEPAGKFEVVLRGIDTHMNGPVAIATQKKFYDVSTMELSQNVRIRELQWLERYLILFKRRNFMMGYVGDQNEAGYTIRFDFGITGILPLDQLQTADELVSGQSLGVILKETIQSKLIVTRKPLEVLNSEPWL